MATVNQVILSGYIIANPKPQVTYYKNGGVRARFKIKTEGLRYKYGGGIESVTEVHNVVAWKYQVPNIESYAEADNFVMIQGSLRTVKVFDEKCNKEFSYTFIATQNMHLIQKANGKDLDRDRP